MKKSSNFNRTQVNNKIGWIVVDQIRTIDKSRIIKKIGRMSNPEITALKSVLKETFVD
ncbi:type II toxin-antitoxin system PemK/MazF family toxin [Aquimarina agarilytica]|uniref:type II toxin-antitoxin system PemK/MazF family toxin n=1 Tax=Aquimarina agarilytica TaxID=1087449 RepID=UPI0009DB0723|nr:type II toxin-antitoxin system PemK/MazF family toxin [Aquimarina agarilytica]